MRSVPPRGSGWVVALVLNQPQFPSGTQPLPRLCGNSAIQKDGSSPANSQVRKVGFHPSGAAPLGWKPTFLTCELLYDLLGFHTVSTAWWTSWDRTYRNSAGQIAGSLISVA